MKELIKYRYNIMEVNSPSAFASIRGGYRQNCRDVYFIRMLGFRPGLIQEIRSMDENMASEMQSGRLFYKRLSCLPRLSAADADAYTACYEQWEAGKQDGVRTKVSCIDEKLTCRLADACSKALEKYQTVKASVTGSIRRNFIVKLLYWFDFVCGGMSRWDERSCIKIVLENVVKEQEYLFCYLLTLLGCDVLLIQSREDLSDEKMKKLSKEIRLGAFSMEKIPEYQSRVPGADYVNSGRPDSGCNSVNSGRPDSGCNSVNSGRPDSGRNTERIYAGHSTAQAEAGHQKTGENVYAESSKSQMAGENVYAGSSRGQTTERNVHAKAGSAIGSEQMTATGSAANGRNSHTDQRIVVKIPERSRRSPSGMQPGTSSPSGMQPGISSPSGIQPGTSSPSAVGPLRAAAQEKSFEELATLASSIVLIAVHDHYGEVISTGSGIMVGRNGYILTNEHVARGGSYYSIRIENDDQVYQTDELIKYHSDLDLALMRISRRLEPLPVYKGAKKLVRGQAVVAIGSPLGLFNSVSNGIISGFRIVDGVHMIQFTAPISRGSSGGAVLNMAGEVIGISTAGFDGGQNINLAVGYESIGMFISGFQ